MNPVSEQCVLTLVQAIFIPVVGILGNDFDRILLICIGSVIWGAMSTGFGFARDLKQVSPPLHTFVAPLGVLSGLPGTETMYAPVAWFHRGSKQHMFVQTGSRRRRMMQPLMVYMHGEAKPERSRCRLAHGR